MTDLISAFYPEPTPKKAHHFKLRTCDAFDSRKHGHAYVAILSKLDGKLTREWIDNSGKLWDRKHKYYSTTFEFDAPDGTVLEARLTDGSWANDYREWYVVSDGALKEVEQRTAVELLDKVTGQ